MAELNQNEITKFLHENGFNVFGIDKTILMGTILAVNRKLLKTLDKEGQLNIIEQLENFCKAQRKELKKKE